MRVRMPKDARALLRRVGRIAEEQGVRAFAVGGCVRDWLLGIPTVEDADVAVEGDGAAAAQGVARALGGTVTMHPQFGTATVRLLSGGAVCRIDVAMCRTERYAQPAAYPAVTPGRLQDDLFRRDFTINAMAAALSAQRFGELIDPYQGAADVEARALRVLHPRSFFDDPSRLLRGVRFAVRFGLAWAPETDAAAREAVQAGALGWLNAGRVRKELERMADEPDPAACLRALAQRLAA